VRLKRPIILGYKNVHLWSVNFRVSVRSGTTLITWYRYHVIRCHPIFVQYSFLLSLIQTWRLCELLSWDRHWHHVTKDLAIISRERRFDKCVVF